VAAQVAPDELPPEVYVSLISRAAVAFEVGDLPQARADYDAAYRAHPGAQALLGLGRVACAQQNYGDCTLLLQAALDAPVAPLPQVVRARAEALLARARRVLLSPEGCASLAEGGAPSAGSVSRTSADDEAWVERPSLWAGVGIALAAVLAVSLVGASAR
jgi:tetratricopeptide (TPR) repeat protein